MLTRYDGAEATSLPKKVLALGRAHTTGEVSRHTHVVSRSHVLERLASKRSAPTPFLVWGFATAILATVIALVSGALSPRGERIAKDEAVARATPSVEATAPSATDEDVLATSSTSSPETASAADFRVPTDVARSDLQPRSDSSASSASERVPGADRVVASLRPQLRKCYAQGLGDDGESPMTGKAVIAVSIDPSGTVRSADITSSEGLPAHVASCVLEVARRARFPETGHHSTLSIPISFVRTAPARPAPITISGERPIIGRAPSTTVTSSSGRTELTRAIGRRAKRDVTRCFISDKADIDAPGRITRVELTILIKADGTVGECAARSSGMQRPVRRLDSSAIATCVAAVARSWVFERSDADVEWNGTFELTTPSIPTDD